MREILFRGKRVDNGEWVYGFLCEIDCINSIHIDNSVGFKTSDKFEVIPESVGQFTGLTDNNGKKIFKGDLINLASSSFGFVSDGNTKPVKYEVKEDGCDYVLYRNDINAQWGRLSRVQELTWYCIKIGNIHDNPELLKL